MNATNYDLASGAVICAFHLPPDGPARELPGTDFEHALAPTGVTWLHLRLSDARAEHYLLQPGVMPEKLQERLQARDERPVLEATAEGLLIVTTDLSFEHLKDPSEGVTLWAYATPRFLLSARTHASRNADALRIAVRNGLPAASGIELVTVFLEQRTESLRDITTELTDEVDIIEDQVLRGDVREQRERLGRIRRGCARIRRHFIPDRVALHRILAKPPGWLAEDERQRLQAVVEELSFVIDEASDLYERAKLLQEELAARVAEKTGDRLFVLSVLSAVLLPMTLVTGIFGMNVVGLPGAHGDSAFVWTMMLVLLSGAATLAGLKIRGLL